MVVHTLRITAITILLVVCTFYPLLPGQNDASAMAVSTTAQLFGAAGLLLVPMGVLWLAYELRKRSRWKRNLPNKDRGYYFALTSLIVASLIAILVSLLILFGIGISFGVLAFTLWYYTVSRVVPRLQLLKTTETEKINPAPYYLLLIPMIILIFQVTLATPVTEFSRNHAITNSAELINDLEEYHAAHGRYPSSLQAVWKDYYPSIIGIEKFHYSPNGDAYNLFFEQPRLLFDNFGTREFVVYNKLDEHLIPSHASWILIWTPEEIQARQGWYAAHETTSPHWKYFWFD